MNKIVGILALQGAYQKHVESLSRLGLESRLIRKPGELDDCSALILPGGESTTISLLMQDYGLYEPIKSFAKNHPVMGVCAGLILMADKVDDERVTPLGLIPFKATRNFYGRQVHSFTAELKLNFDSNSNFQAHFIRAPGIEELSAEVEVLATYDDKAIIIGAGKHIALSFHPELTNDTRIHQYWLSKQET
ncbi:MAG: pyridoxal 5'-phosphate synthase glutaminase subunit PdxT [Gammaproteobacteria bacterium]|nr:pyridoxal 5'-phosphate synthase glutaminase subunit PdxT [Gammaproteobacteria bacterium]